MKFLSSSLLLFALLMNNLYAQRDSKHYMELGPSSKSHVIATNTNSSNIEKSIVWSETFDIGTISPTTTIGPTFSTSNGTWTTGAANGDVWKHSFFESSGEWSAGVIPFNTTTANNGFMLFDADSVNTPFSPNYIPLTGELISPPIDLTGQVSALLMFEQDFRYCCGGVHDLIVSVSSDNGVTWGQDHNLAVGGSQSDGYYNWNGNSFQTLINLSAEAAGNTVLLKFTWGGNASGNTHYYWSIDDICIATLPTDDIQVLSSWITGENNNGLQYGRTPENHQDPNYIIGSEIYNYGSSDQTNVVLNTDFTSFSSTGNYALLESDSTVRLETVEALSLSPGVYSGTYTATSDGEIAGGPNFANNTDGREFEITESTGASMPSSYSLDGIGVYSNPVTSSIGTNSFVGAADGLQLATMYHIKESDLFCALRVMLNPGTIPYGEIYGAIYDTADFWMGNQSPVISAPGIIVSALDVTNGYVDIMFVYSPALTLNPGAYYAVIELYSNGNSNDIIVMDDETIPQPSDASAIYIPGDQAYTNGTALGIRLLYYPNCYWGLEENTLSGVSIFPNPSTGVVNITNDNETPNTINVHDILGQLITTKIVSSETSIDLSAYGTGIYIVKISNNSGTMTERIVIE